MIIMVNGAFGVGKTTVATGLLAHIPNSMLFDPEEVGQMLRRIGTGIRAPDEAIDDFQNEPLWPELTVEVGRLLFNEYRRPMIVPMTLVHVPYFTAISNGLSALTPDFHHFCLTASVAEIHRRLAQRGDEAGSWPFQQTERCVAAHRDPIFSEHIDSENGNPQQIQQRILNTL